MKKSVSLIACLLMVLVISASFTFDEHKTLAIGSAAPDFNLKGIDGKMYSLASFKDAKVLVVVFMCNHCPTSQAYEPRMIKLTRDYAPKGVRVVAINPNNPASLRLDELGYSDVGDSYPEMKIRAKSAGFNFPYLYDGATETASRKYGPIATPHIFIFDRDRKLRYQGRIDDMEDPAKTPSSYDARNAIDAILAGKEVPVTTTKVFGCSVKWIEKKDWIKKAEIQWAKEPVSLQDIDAAGVSDLMKNKTDKLLMINLWATWCVPCVEEFPDLVTANRMYRDRDFKMITISSDALKDRDKALAFLEKKQSSSLNYIYTGDSKYKLIESIDPKWQGALPYTILVEPGGKIVYAKEGKVNADSLKQAIINNPLIGRIYKVFKEQ
ncbi:redoxin family protein [Mucilaginibacter ginsenosidivorans]|uniref:Redoxin domain-containing protein n=1 Tax=Mucilaginibacter ginsenosidivorans TaxID=398053 RepID=A0A5B8UVD4_9SPHI|nr:redoxin domain-containing protein [Mucilaginibacter ginsenosidivorans]QEC62869.1 redoxin domain-containing protein [Mucilaginibacter ginsenosidivorans]